MEKIRTGRNREMKGNREQSFLPWPQSSWLIKYFPVSEGPALRQVLATVTYEAQCKKSQKQNLWHLKVETKWKLRKRRNLYLISQKVSQKRTGGETQRTTETLATSFTSHSQPEVQGNAWHEWTWVPEDYEVPRLHWAWEAMCPQEPTWVTSTWSRPSAARSRQQPPRWLG